jgi:hypothetical protein
MGVQMRPKLTFANVVSVIALFVALGGTGLAASQLGKNSVGPKQLKKNAVTTAKIKNEAVTGAKVKKGTLTGTQINVSTLGMVPSAANAQALGGQSANQISEAARVRCPSGTIPSAGVCVEAAERKPPTILIEAMLECAKSNRRLPSLGDLITFDIQNFSEPPNPEWVEPEYVNAGHIEANVVSASAPNNVTIAAQDTFTNHRYRCVATATN